MMRAGKFEFKARFCFTLHYMDPAVRGPSSGYNDSQRSHLNSVYIEYNLR